MSDHSSPRQSLPESPHRLPLESIYKLALVEGEGLLPLLKNPTPELQQRRKERLHSLFMAFGSIDNHARIGRHPDQLKAEEELGLKLPSNRLPGQLDAEVRLVMCVPKNEKKPGPVTRTIVREEARRQFKESGIVNEPIRRGPDPRRQRLVIDLIINAWEPLTGRKAAGFFDPYESRQSPLASFIGEIAEALELKFNIEHAIKEGVNRYKERLREQIKNVYI